MFSLLTNSTNTIPLKHEITLNTCTTKITDTNNSFESLKLNNPFNNKNIAKKIAVAIANNNNLRHTEETSFLLPPVFIPLTLSPICIKVKYLTRRITVFFEFTLVAFITIIIPCFIFFVLFCLFFCALILSVLQIQLF